MRGCRGISSWVTKHQVHLCARIVCGTLCEGIQGCWRETSRRREQQVACMWLRMPVSFLFQLL